MANNGTVKQVTGHDHPSPTHRTVARACDVLVIGGGPAGLAAALQLGRQNRSVIVVDAGEPRNAPAAHMHGYLGLEGLSPAEMRARGRADVRRYGVEVLDGHITDVHPTGDTSGFRADLTGGHSVTARKLIVATGLVDVLPEIDGLSDQWGRGVIHCPFCHGYEARHRPIVAIVTHPMGLHAVTLFAHLTDRLTVVLHEPDVAASAGLAEIRAAGVPVETARVRRVVEDAGRVVGVEIDDGRFIEADAVAVGPRFAVRTEGFASLGLTTAAHPSGLGDVLAVDGTGATSVPGMYAAGNVADPSLQVLPAAAHGSRVGSVVAYALADEDQRHAGAPAANAVDWDRRYGGDRIWSGHPNGTLVAEVAGLPVGTALDVGAGEGGDAIWLAEQGWTVTAADVSGRALDIVRGEAERRKLPIRTLHADANSIDAFRAAGPFDLVTAFYASIPRTADDRALGNLVHAVAAGGTLLVVGHDPGPMRAPVDTSTRSRMFDPDSFVGVDDFARVLAAHADWTIETHEKRTRPGGSATAAHHVDDIVFRARRLA